MTPPKRRLADRLLPTDTQYVSHPANTDGHSRPWWFFILGLWRTIPIAFAIGVGYAIGHPTIGALIALAFFASGFVFSRWARGSQARIRHRLQQDPDYRRAYQARSDRLARAFGLYFAGMGAIVVLFVVAWLIAKLV
jgi:hypothetical protein